MSRKKRRRDRRGEDADRTKRPEPGGTPRSKGPGRGRVIWLVGAAILGAIGVVVVVIVVQLAGDAGAGALPPPPAVPADSGPTGADFVGSEVCGSCHGTEYAAWRGSTHGRAGGPASTEWVVAPFGGTPIRFSDASVTPQRTGEGEYVFRVAQRGEAERVYRVAWVVGGGHMVGGGTQAFFAEFPDGTLRFLPFDYSVTQGVWFCQTGGRAASGWVPITPTLSITDCGDWPPRRVLGTEARFANCQNCHGSQVQLAFDASAGRYETRFTELAINCESCHGPGRRHVELARSGEIETSADIGMRPLELLDEDASLSVCFQCHAVKEEIRGGYLPGKRLERHYGLKLPLLSYRPFYPDGRIRLFAYQQQHLYSDCYVNGAMTCVDCHDPHSQGYRDIWDKRLEGRFSDGQCTDCHASKAMEVERHTHHRDESPGSRCVFCHMPYLQEPDVGSQIPYARSDHTIPIPRPGLDAFFGIENACQKCHTDRSPEELQAQIRDWWGELKPPKRLLEGIVRARGARDINEAAELMLEPDATSRVLQFSGLAYFTLGYLSPNMPALPPAIVARLARLSESPDPDVQALALASLHLARGADPEVRALLAERLEALGARDEMAVRRRWVWALSFRGTAYMESGDGGQAVAAFEKAREVLPEDPEVLRKLGRALLGLRRYDEAIERLERSLEIEPVQPLALVDLASGRMQRGELDGALDAYRRAIELNPHEPMAYLGLGQALLRAGRVSVAIEALERSVALDPGLADAYLALATAQARRGQREEGIAAIQRGLRFAPDDGRLTRMLDRLSGGR